ncbi:MAG: diacylglycerol kinase family lipid kinase [Clostridia bacterium]|nr:diacylglycerol kinase family lipid kinase [Clostridia bacterium]
MYIMILNPNSGRGIALKKLPEIEAILHQQGIEYRIEKDHDESQTSEVVRRAVAEKPEGIIVLGGDGTLFRVANGMVGSDVPLIFVSCGTGNDFVRALNLPKDPIEALKLQLSSPVRRIDTGRMNETCFLNVSGTGFDVDVLRLVDKYKEKHSGLKAYLLALAAALKAYKPMTAMISVDGEPEQEISFAILSIGNGRYFGGGMKAVPTAVVNDGLFDLVIVRPVKKAMIPFLLVFYIAGKHVDLKFGTLRRCKSVTVRRKASTFNLDGELMDTDSARYQILPGAITVRVPGL